MLELLNVNTSSGEPIYRQLNEQIVRLIVGGQLQSEQVLPSVRQIAEHLTVNPMTVSRAIQILVEQGWLERRRGQPTRVTKRNAYQDAELVSNQTVLLTPQLDVLLDQAKQLGISLDTLQVLLSERWTQQ